MFKSIREVQSADANVKKFVYEFDKPAVAEAVLYRYGDYQTRTVICCSTQSGCPVGCRFCGAGNYFVRSLTADEIVAQPVHLLESHNIDVPNVQRIQIMFMSMGEPLLNLRALDEACHRLYALYPNAALLISTSAPRVDYADVRALSLDVPTIGLQFSVHESTDEARDLLIPFAHKLSLREIAAEGVAWAAATGRAPFFNYCAHDRNTSDADADRLAVLFDSGIWQATISVICESEESVAAANARQESLAFDFQQKLGARGYSTRMFNPAGQDDIGGGCGQLWFVQDWMRSNPTMARPSVGFGRPAVHTPASIPN